MDFAQLLASLNMPGMVPAAPTVPSIPSGVVGPPEMTPNAAAPMPPAPMPQKKAGAKDLLLQLGPVLASAIINRRNPHATQALVQGMMQGQQVASQRSLQVQEREQARKMATARMLQDFAQGAAQLEDPQQFAQYLELAESTLASVDPTFQPGTLKRSVSFPASKAAKKLQAEAEATVKKLMAVHGDNFAQLAENGSATFQGKSIKIRDLMGLAEMNISTDKGPAPLTQPPAKSDEPGSFAWRFAQMKQEKEAALGRPLSLAEQNALTREVDQQMKGEKATTPSSIESALVAAHGRGDQAEVARLTTLAKQLGDARRAPEGAGGPALIQVTTTDPETGEQVTSLVPKQPGEVARRPPKEPNQAQYTAATYAQRVEQAEPIIAKLEGGIAGMNLLSYEAQLRAPSALQSATMQSYMQAARNYINSVLRRESGAVISPEEFKEARQQYLPQPGDTPEVRKQKAENRRVVRETLKRSAGNAYEPPVSGAGATTQPTLRFNPATGKVEKITR